MINFHISEEKNWSLWVEPSGRLDYISLFFAPQHNRKVVILPSIFYSIYFWLVGCWVEKTFLEVSFVCLCVCGMWSVSVRELLNLNRAYKWGNVYKLSNKNDPTASSKKIIFFHESGGNPPKGPAIFLLNFDSNPFGGLFEIVAGFFQLYFVWLNGFVWNLNMLFITLFQKAERNCTIAQVNL